MKNIDMKLKWQPFELCRPFFEYRYVPRELPECPAIYRLRRKRPDGTIQEVYIGETGNLFERARRHRSTTDTKGLRQRFSGITRIYLDTLEIKPFQINNRHYSARSLRVEYKRQLIESIMLYKALDQGYKIRNKGYE